MDHKGKNWECSKCTLINENALKDCKSCGFRRTQSLSSGFSSISIQKPNSCQLKGEGFLQADGVREDEIRIVLIGKTGSGKSATGNTILDLPDHFESVVSGESITKMCKRGQNFRFEKTLMVVDTPGLFDTSMTNELVTKEIVKCIGMTSPGPHAIVLVVQIGRFTNEERDTVIQFADNFGEEMYNYLIVLFTRKDDLDRQRMGIDQYVTKVPEDLKRILERSEQRYIAFDNIAAASSKESDSKALLSMIEDMVHGNGGSYYTNEMYREAEKALKRRMEEIRTAEKEKKDREIKEIKDRVARDYEKVIDQVKAEKVSIQDTIKELKEERRRDRMKEQRMDQQWRDLQRQREIDDRRLREQQEETRRQRNELMKAMEQQQQLNNEREKMREKEMAQMKELQKEQTRQTEEQRRQLEEERERQKKREEERQEIMREREKLLQEKLEFQAQKLIEMKKEQAKQEELRRKLENERMISQQKEEEHEAEIRENEKKLREQAERERRERDEMQREQKRREREKEEEYERNTEAVRIRERARDECETGNKGVLSWLWGGIQRVWKGFKSIFF